MGSCIIIDVGVFILSLDFVLSFGMGFLIFSIFGGDLFIINVDFGIFFVDFREVINSVDDNFGVIVNIIDIGIVEGFCLVFLFEEIGDGNDLVINNDIGVVELDRFLIVGGINNISVVNIEFVKNVIVFVDGIEV